LMASHVRRDGPLMFAIDGSKYPRPDTRYVDDVGLQYAAERDHGGGAPAVPGWMMQWVAQVGGAVPRAGRKGSWAFPVDVARLGTRENANELAARQIAGLVGRLRADGRAASALFLLDAGYCPIYLTQRLPVDAQILVRLRGDRGVLRAGPGPGARPGGPPEKARRTVRVGRAGHLGQPGRGADRTDPGRRHGAGPGLAR